MRPLIIDADAKTKIKQVRDYAALHHYHPSDPTPGDKPEYRTQLGTYRVVFTYTDDNGLLYRHLSVSVPSKQYPNPIAVFIIAEEFGFTGWEIKMGEKPGADWMIDVNKLEHCVVVLQPVAMTAPVEQRQ